LNFIQKLFPELLIIACRQIKINITTNHVMQGCCIDICMVFYIQEPVVFICRDETNTLL